MIRIIFKSILNRKLSFLLTVFSIAISVSLFIGVERVRLGAQENFANSTSQADLVVGARGNAIQLLLYTIFHIGNPTNNISWSSYKYFSAGDDIDWTIPFSFGDSYQGFHVVATNENFYKDYRFLGNKKPEFLLGHFATELFTVSLGSTVAKKENLKIGDKITLTHGVNGDSGMMTHMNKPFTVVGILKTTRTPLDKALYINLEGTKALHGDYKLSSFLVGTKSKESALALQGEINDYKKEPLMAIMPAVTLSELWQSVSYIDVVLKIVTFAVIGVGLIGMMVSIFNSLDARRREVAILRAIGAGMKSIFLILIAESFILSLVGCIFGMLFCYLILFAIQPIFLNEFGIAFSFTSLQFYEYVYLLIVVIFASLLGIIPAYRAYKNSLSDGLSLRI